MKNVCRSLRMRAAEDGADATPLALLHVDERRRRPRAAADADDERVDVAQHRRRRWRRCVVVACSR